MHPVAIKCTRWSVGLLILGSLANAFGPDLYMRLADYAGINAAAGLRALDLVLTVTRWVTLPLGASLVGAAVVIQTLAPYLGWVAGTEIQDDEVQGRERA